LTPAEITAESNALMAAIEERVRLRDALLQSLSGHASPQAKRRVREECRELRALNRAASKRLAELDLEWQRVTRRGSTDAA
jgi:rRNA-processing protein FCF1